jgi:hypothetical protein
MEINENEYFVRGSTPSARPLYSTTFSDLDKERVLKADPNEGLCLLTNYDFSTDFCHCIPKNVMNDDEMVRVYRIYLF